MEFAAKLKLWSEAELEVCVLETDNEEGGHLVGRSETGRKNKQLEPRSPGSVKGT